MMLSNSKRTLLSIAGPTLVSHSPLASIRGVSEELCELLEHRNGFYAFESALHFYPSSVNDPLSVENWNKVELWMHEYSIPSDVVFFAQDVFGGQFGLTDGGVQYFEPETGDLTAIAASLEEFIQKILLDFRTLTGHAFVHDWQEANGPIPHGMRLAPKIPFVLGGEYSLSNLCVVDQLASMRARAQIARQIADLPDGACVEIKTN